MLESRERVKIKRIKTKMMLCPGHENGERRAFPRRGATNYGLWICQAVNPSLHVARAKWEAPVTKKAVDKNCR